MNPTASRSRRWRPGPTRTNFRTGTATSINRSRVWKSRSGEQCLKYVKATGVRACLLVDFREPNVEVGRTVLKNKRVSTANECLMLVRVYPPLETYLGLVLSAIGVNWRIVCSCIAIGSKS